MNLEDIDVLFDDLTDDDLDDDLDSFENSCNMVESVYDYCEELSMTQIYWVRDICKDDLLNQRFKSDLLRYIRMRIDRLSNTIGERCHFCDFYGLCYVDKQTLIPICLHCMVYDEFEMSSDDINAIKIDDNIASIYYSYIISTNRFISVVLRGINRPGPIPICFSCVITSTSRGVCDECYQYAMSIMVKKYIIAYSHICLHIQITEIIEIIVRYLVLLHSK